MLEAKSNSTGLRGQNAGETSLCTVGQSGTSLSYRGYDIRDLAAHCCFEEVVHLLLDGALPNLQRLNAYQEHLASLRALPKVLIKILEHIPASAHAMDVMRTGTSVLGNLETEKEDFSDQKHVAERLIACLPAIICYWYHFSHHNKRIDTHSDEPTLAGHFLKLLKGSPPAEDHRACLDASLILYAEHEFNASTFTARVCASTLSDMHSCITGAIGSLRGPLHGGANEAAMAMISRFQTPAEAEIGVKALLARKEKIMGFGHAIYKTCDPRNAIIKDWAKCLAKTPREASLFAISEAIETLLWQEKKLFPNADFYHACAYLCLGIPTILYTPIFVCARASGWTAHVMEQRANNRIIRPSATYVGSAERSFIALTDRP